ncbi:hypothetical protein [Tautonia sociabilis]|uniref:Response regulator n=1 Tax=Tautonia sociabilis TaxID=2080755 RepID=A0A432MIV3_9BACT|nr:hypothetical protein [Tautonia sociabilis]RUL87135.1 hypothetical protein TsocGM_13720 [Tautonia sociabilis]
MDRPLVVIHERRGYWAGQLRARLHDRPARWRETRGTADLLLAASSSPVPIVILDLGDRPAEVLERLVRLSVSSPSSLVLALDPGDRPELRQPAREFGASAFWPGFAPPPRVAALVDRWLALARQRLSRVGRAALPEAEPDPADPMTLLAT